ncbi:MAG TPA: DUF3046 domain-containing protein [Mycobacteriales bacterium]
MRLTDFWQRMDRAFGAGYADSVARDQVIEELGSRTVHEALDAGEDAQAVWRAVWAHFELPARER